MFENTIAQKRLLRKKKLLDELEKAKNDNNEWKINQLEMKIKNFEKKYYPNVLWDSSKGSYVKKEN